MIRINLLPEELKGRRARAAAAGPAGPAPSWLVYVPIVLLGLVDVFLFWKVFSAQAEAAAATRKMQTELSEKEKTRDAKLKDFQELRNLMAKLDNQIEILRQLDPPDRLLWSEKLNMLALAITPEAFITELTVTEKVTEVETEESIKAREAWEKDKSEKEGPPPKEVKVPIITQTLAINGVCSGVNEQEQFDNALRFAEVLRNFKAPNARGVEEAFMDGFQGDLGYGNFEATQLEGRDVCKFTFTLTTKPISGGKV